MKTPKQSLLLIAIIFISYFSYAQDPPSKWAINSYVDAYYVHNDDQGVGLKPFTSTSPRGNQFGLNIAQIGIAYTSNDIRSKIDFHMGDIPIATWSRQLPFVQQANVGVHVVKDWWLDIGMFTTHIGTESFLPKENLLSSVAAATYNEPFYQAGAKLAYEGSEKYDLEFWALNGYNLFRDNNRAKSFGLLFTYYISDHTSFTYTNLFGRESQDDIEPIQFRGYHNAYIESQITDKFQLIIGADIGTQTHSKLNNPTETAMMFNALVTMRYQFTKKFSTTARYEYFQDEEGFISGVLDINNMGLTLTAYTWGIEYKPNKGSYLRLESRFISLADAQKIFIHETGNTNQRWETMVTFGHAFEKNL